MIPGREFPLISMKSASQQFLATRRENRPKEETDADRRRLVENSNVL